MPLPTLDDFKRHLTSGGRQSELDGDSAELSDHLAAAINVVEGIVGPLRARPVLETHRGVYSDVVLLRRRPVQSLQAVSFRLYAGWDPVERLLTDFDLDADAGLLRLASGYPFRGDVTVTYTVGFDTVPSAVQLATLMIGKQMWDTQRGAQPLPLQGADEQPTFQSFAPGIPDRARVLLEPFARGPQVA